MIELKVCNKCREHKPQSEYSPSAWERSYSYCKGCQSEYNRERRQQPDAQERRAETSAAHYAANRERKAETGAAWRATNRERKAATNAAWYVANKEQINASNAAWRAANKEKFAATQAAYYANNTADYAARGRVRRQHISKHAMPAWLTEQHKQQMNAVYAEARRITEETGVLHTVDHIWPLKGKNSCGLHAPWNLQILTGSENDAKCNKEPHDTDSAVAWPDAFEIDYAVAAE
jgi:hypothetical protein